MRLRVAIALTFGLALGLSACRGVPGLPTLSMRPAVGTLAVHIGASTGYHTQYLQADDWEDAQAVLSAGGTQIGTADGPATVDPATNQRSATLTFGPIVPGAAYDLTINLRRRDSSGTWQIVATQTKTGLALSYGQNVLSLAPFNARQTGNATPAGLSGARVESLLPGAPAARLWSPMGLAIMPNGDLLVSEAGDHRLRRIHMCASGATVSTVAGNGTMGYADGPGQVAEMSYPSGIVAQSNTQIWVMDGGDGRLRDLTPDSYGEFAVTTPVGNGIGGYQDGPGPQAEFNGGSAIAQATDGSIYLADWANDRIRRIRFNSGAATVDTVAGNGTAGFVDGAALGAEFRYPSAIAVGPDGAVYIDDKDNGRVRKLTFDPVSGAGTVCTVAGSGSWGFADGAAGNAAFADMYGLAADAKGNLYVGDRANQRIRKITFPGGGGAATVSTLAGNGNTGMVDGPGASAEFQNPRGVAVDASGTVYVADVDNHAVRKIVTDPTTGAATVSRVAGDGTAGWIDGPARAASVFNNPHRAVFDASGALYVADTGHHQIRKVTFDAQGDALATLVAGNGTAGTVNGAGGTAEFNQPFGLAFDAAGTLYVSSVGDNTVRKLVFDGTGAATVSTVAGDGNAGDVDGAGATAEFRVPYDLATDTQGRVIVVDAYNHALRRITFDALTGAPTVSTLAGNGTSGWVDGPAASARFNLPAAIVRDGQGNFYVADTNNHRIRKLSFDSGGAATVSTVAGNGTAATLDGVGTAAEFNTPHGLAIDASGRLYVAGDNYVRRVTFDASGVATVTTIAGDGNPGLTDGPAASARFTQPKGVAVDSQGRVVVVDTYNSWLRRIDF